MLRTIIKRAGLCLALAGLGLAAVWGAWHLMELREPRVDFSLRAQVAGTPASRPGGDDAPLRFAVATMVSAEATFSTYRRLVRRISRSVGREAKFVMRPSYAEVRRQLEEGQVDVAFVCTGTYVHGLRQKRIRLLVQPEFPEGRDYRCLFIVPVHSLTQTIDDLRGRVLALTDPESNTGCLVPAATLGDLGYNPKSFFRRVVFTGSHDRSILAVAGAVVDCAAVDSLVWGSAAREDPSLPGRVRVIWRSEPFGPPPIVVPKGLSADLERSLLEAFLALDKDEEGREILSGIGIKRFVPASPESYQTAVRLYQRLAQRGGPSWP